MRHVAPFIHPGSSGLKLKAPMARPGGPLARPQEHVEKRQELVLQVPKVALHQESEIDARRLGGAFDRGFNDAPDSLDGHGLMSSLIMVNTPISRRFPHHLRV